MSTKNFSGRFVQGTIEGSWWSYLMFVTNGFTPYVDIRKVLQRIFAVIWIMISLVIIIIFIAMFTTSLTIYAIEGQTLESKAIGVNKFSSDRTWIDLENANPVGNYKFIEKKLIFKYHLYFKHDFFNLEYTDFNELFKDLDDLKLDYIILDHIYANFYSKLINERFYVMKFIPRKRSYNVALRGFNPDQVTCFQTVTAILSQQWLKTNISTNENRVKKKNSFFFILCVKLIFPYFLKDNK